MQVLWVSCTLGEFLSELLNEAGYPDIRFGNRTDTLQAHLLDQTILKCPIGMFYTAFGLW